MHFNYTIPLRAFLENGGNLNAVQIVLTDSLLSQKYQLVTRNKNALTIKNAVTGEETRSHVDVCWVIVKVSWE